MKNKLLYKFTISVILLWTGNVLAVSSVNPSGLNVRFNGPTTAFLTFQDTAGQTSTEAFWCGEVTTTSVTNTNPCVPGTFLGSLPKRHDLSRNSGTGNVNNFTDIMTVPASVARRAYQAAKNGQNSSFFYVRKFEGTGGDQYIAVTCRLAGGGARTPLALLDVRPAFQTPLGDRPLYLFAQGAPAAPFNASIYYNGSGRLKGRWEVVMPGDPEPTSQDLIPEASLPIEQRSLQRRYTVIDHFDIFLPPTGRANIPGPSVKKIPTTIKGAYKILLRIEATKDKEGNSNTNNGVVSSGGVAGFPMPVLRYYVGDTDTVNEALSKKLSDKISLMLPLNDSTLPHDKEINLSWSDINNADIYRLEIFNNNDAILSALVQPGVSNYTPPPWIFDYANTILRWRIQALNQNGQLLGQSNWRTFTISE